MRRLDMLNNHINSYSFTGVFTHSDGAAGWYSNGKLHRLDGPAIEYANGKKEWWVYGEEIKDLTSFNLLANMLKLKNLSP